MLLFQSTLPVWGATATNKVHTVNKLISIHAPRVGSDEGLRQDMENQGDFNPRSPCGERHLRLAMITQMYYISIHAPRVGSDVLRQTQRSTPVISIHAPRVGSDWRVP